MDMTPVLAEIGKSYLHVYHSIIHDEVSDSRVVMLLVKIMALFKDQVL